MSRKSSTYLWMVLPAAILFFGLQTLPSIEAVFYSFTNWVGYGKYNFIGLKNYLGLFHDSQVIHSYVFTFQFAIVSTIVVNIVSLSVAVALDAKIKLMKTLRAIFFLPNVLSLLIVGYVFNYIFSFVTPQIAQSLGLDSLSTNILGSPRWAWVGVVIVSVWQGAAFNIIIYLAGLQTIPDDIYEAAEIDGARPWKRFWRITFPLISAFFTINMVLSLKNFLMVFDQVVALTGGGPGMATQSVSYVIYTNGFNGGQFAYQLANAVIYMVIIIFVSLFQIRGLQNREVQL